MELTRSPQLNDLIRCAELYQQGQRTEEELKQSLRQMEALYRGLFGAFQHQLQVHDKTAPVWQSAPALEEQFKALRRGLEMIRAWFTEPRAELLYDGLDTARLAMDALFVIFDSLQQMEQALPHLSDNPFMHEVLRVGRLVVEGKLPPAALKDILTRMKALQKQSAEQMLALPAPTEEDKKLRLQIRRLLERVYAGLKEAEQYFVDQKTEHIERGLESSQQAMKELYDIKQAVEEPATSDTFRSCWRCHQDVPSHLSTCEACGFRFPVVVADGAPLPAQVVVRTPSGHTPTEMTERLMEALEEVQNGGPFAPLATQLGDLRRRLAQARSDLQAVPGPPLNDVEQTTAFQEHNRLMEEYFDLMQQGAERMARYEKGGDAADLTEGVELILLANDQLVDMQDVEAPAEAHGN